MLAVEGPTISAGQQASSPAQDTVDDTPAADMPLAFIQACSPPVVCSDSQGMFDCVLHSLQEASWPSHPRRSGVISALSPGSGYFNFGVQLSRKSCLTHVTAELPQICRDLNALFRFLFPTAHWNTICVSRDCISHLHADTANVPGSPNLSLSLGPFTGGRLWLEDLHCMHLGAPTSIPSGDSWLHGVAIDTRCRPISFDGRIRHMTLPFRGERWALTAFTLPGVCCSDLEFLGFPLPCSAGAPSLPLPLSGSSPSSVGVAPLGPPAPVVPKISPPAGPAAVCSAPAQAHKPASSFLPPGAKLWGKRSTSGYFVPHSLKVQRPVPPPPDSWRADAFEKSLAGRFFLEVTSGASASLCPAIRHVGGNSLLVETAVDASLDILEPNFLEQMLFLCGSGSVAYLAASIAPLHSCTAQSLGTHSSPAEEMAAQEHLCRVIRCCWLLSITHTAGGQGHLSLPADSALWSEASTSGWSQQGNCAMVRIPRRAVPPTLHSAEIWATSFRPLASLAHASFSAAPGSISLPSRFASCVAPLLQGSGIQLSVQTACENVPRKHLAARPHALHDGGGRFSVADWSSPGSSDTLKGLRRAFLDLCLSVRADKRLLARASIPAPEPLFSATEVEQARALVFPALGIPAPSNAWYIHPYQPMCLHAFEALARHCGDPDEHLFPHLRMGVPTGYLNDIPPSNCFWPPKGESASAAIPLTLNLENWQSATVEPSVTSRLLQEELDAGYCFKFGGSVAEAKAYWPVGLALGKLGVVRAPGRAERLVLDNSVAGTNSQCHVPEKQCFPNIQDVSHCFPLRESSTRQMGICIDVKQAHKRCRIKNSEQGLLGFTWQDELYFFRCCPFGAVFSQHWWGRVGGCALRLLHTLIFFAHMGLLFVDDFIFSQAFNLMPLTGAMICLFLQVVGIPVSWKKLQMSCRVDWIGWRLCFSSGTVSLREEKRLRLLECVRSLLRANGRVSVKDLESFLGLSMWACALFPNMRAMLHPFYRDLWSPAATNFSVAPSSWHSIRNFLDASLRFVRSPPHTAIPVGAKLLSARHIPLLCLADLSKVAVTHKRLWLRIECLSSSRRKLSSASTRALHAFERWLQFVPPLASMRPSPHADVEAFADASAKGRHCCLGGFVSSPSLGQVWFSESFSVSDFEEVGIPFGSDLAKEIASCEALAQAGLILGLSALAPCCRVPLCLPSLCDNTGAESGLNKMFSTKHPLGLVLEHIALLASILRITLDVSHVPGAKNVKADALSRPDEHPVPSDCLPSQRMRFSLANLWHPGHCMQPFPSGP